MTSLKTVLVGVIVCVCFDFAIDISGIESGIIPARLQLTVDDETVTKWEGSIDLSEGKGIVIVSDEPTIWCTPDDSVTVQKALISDCGGFDGAGLIENTEEISVKSEKNGD